MKTAAAASAVGAHSEDVILHNDLRARRCAQGETLGLAVSLELPPIVIDIQRRTLHGSTTTEQADSMTMYGRHSESPMPIVAPRAQQIEAMQQ